MGKGCPHDPGEQGFVVHLDRGPSHHQGDHSRAHFGARTEAARRDLEGQRGLRRILHQDRKDPVVVRRRFCHQSSSDLGLQHQDHPINSLPRFQERKQQRGGDIVRKVGHHNCSSRQRLVGKLQRIAEPKIEIATVSQHLSQISPQLWVELKRDHLPGCRAERSGQDSPPRSDLQHGFLRPDCSQCDYFAGDVRVNQEMLAEALSRRWNSKGHG